MKQKSKNGIILLLCALGLETFAFAVYFVKHYSVDTFAVYFANDSQIHIQNARYLSFLLDSILLKCGFNFITFQYICVLLLIVGLAICMYKMIKLLCIFGNIRDLKNYCGIFLIVSVAFVNVFLSEWFIYAETDIYYSLSILLVIMAVCIIVKENKWWIQFGVPFLCVCASLLFYQASMPIFVIWSNTFFFIKYYLNHQKGQLVKNVFGVLIIGGAGSVISVVGSSLTAGTSTTRKAVLSIRLIIDNLLELISIQKSIWESALGLMPRYAVLIIVLVLLVILTIIVKDFQKCEVLFLILILGINYAIVFAPHLVSSEIWMAPRTIVGWFSWISSLGAIAWFILKNDKVRYFIYGLYLVLLVLGISEIWLVGLDQIKTNQIEKQEAVMIQKMIDDYEEQTGNIITKVAVTSDQQTTYYYSEVEKRCLDINARSYVVSWGDVNALNYFNKKQYERVTFENVKYINYFHSKNWDSFAPGEQCILEGDTLYWCVY